MIYMVLLTGEGWKNARQEASSYERFGHNNHKGVVIMENNYNNRKAKYDVIVVGGGLAGLSCAFHVSKKGRDVLLLEKNEFLGGRTSSFFDGNMEVESGLHRYIGYYKELPKLLKGCGVKINDIVTWEEKVDILVKDQKKKIVLGVSPFYGPIKAVRGITDNELLSAEDIKSLTKFFIRGIVDFVLKRDLDSFSLDEYANMHKVTKNAQELILEPLSSELFFLSTGNYSAFAFFNMFVPAIPRLYRMRVGAFLGGMSDVMCEPIANCIKELGGVIRTCEAVNKILINNGSAVGVCTDNNNVFLAEKVVIATPIAAAKELLVPLKEEGSFKNFFSLPTMSACTLQIELNEPSMEKDITTFGPGTDMVSFAEQSRSTFRNKKGRLSLIFGKRNKYIEMSAEELLEVAVVQLESLGINIKEKIRNYRKVSERDEFYALTPGSQGLRPRQKTKVKGLVLAGDYTLTSSLCTMEGAVISGKKAAKLCTK